MPLLPIVIIHGWSDSSASFKPLADAIAAKLGRQVTTISLADWESMDDLVNYDDLVSRMDRAWTDAKLPRTPRSVDVIVHSTGALVLRDWLVRNFGVAAAAPAAGPPAATPCPVYHLVMLAPANFGSPLAAKGTSFIGRVVKGWHGGEVFQVGALVLKGLELASTYTWNLARQDRFGSVNFYDVGGALTTVLVGNTGWTGIAAAANEPGSDGTVRVSTANMNASYIVADFTNGNQPAAVTWNESVGTTAFGVLNGVNHATVHDPSVAVAFDQVIRALQIDDAGFPQWCKDLDALTASTMGPREAGSDPYYFGYQNVVSFLRDQFYAHVQDYFLEFYSDQNNFLEDLFHRKLVQDVHPFSDDAAFRSLLVDITTLKKNLADPRTVPIKISLSAQPPIAANKVGYATYDDQDIGAITLNRQEIDDFFCANQTTMLELIIRRQQKDEIFTFSGVQMPAVGP